MHRSERPGSPTVASCPAGRPHEGEIRAFARFDATGAGVRVRGCAAAGRARRKSPATATGPLPGGSPDGIGIRAAGGAVELSRALRRRLRRTSDRDGVADDPHCHQRPPQLIVDPPLDRRLFSGEGVSHEPFLSVGPCRCRDGAIIQSALANSLNGSSVVTPFGRALIAWLNAAQASPAGLLVSWA
jgi:hypothetical protein